MSNGPKDGMVSETPLRERIEEEAEIAYLAWYRAEKKTPKEWAELPKQTRETWRRVVREVHAHREDQRRPTAPDKGDDTHDRDLELAEFWLNESMDEEAIGHVRWPEAPQALRRLLESVRREERQRRERVPHVDRGAEQARGRLEERRLIAEWLRGFGHHRPAFSGDLLAAKVECCEHVKDAERRAMLDELDAPCAGSAAGGEVSHVDVEGATQREREGSPRDAGREDGVRGQRGLPAVREAHGAVDDAGPVASPLRPLPSEDGGNVPLPPMQGETVMTRGSAPSSSALPWEGGALDQWTRNLADYASMGPSRGDLRLRLERWAAEVRADEREQLCWMLQEAPKAKHSEERRAYLARVAEWLRTAKVPPGTGGTAP